ncbi:MoaD/ThiS family protein [Beggiatoa leptomitoformis]|uniref:Molybdopterin synthase sulfur carrier subunit n=1 Tax=Beggiatoa leptomitoformis TaxID=288004 RepID=A0A2N9YDM9_9GAMM|nr:MoaD/ThiS family protein [Beggiatoa leptomitoformis]ALG69010.1 molybdopterin synthase sulfur carrier subunit [Beggiatoa leptomitoformis]AUI68591.1 molybdopterin synthase sulfur carrier subunit [Beggiatoa leptomitoformis]
MSITVKFFASLRQLVGKKEVQLDIVHTLTASDVWAQVCNDPLPTHALIAINLEYVSPETCVKEGDEVAFFPPVTGG